MKKIIAVLLLAGSVAAQANPALTIYNQNFAVVHELVPLQLNAGVNQVSFDGITSFVEPSSVVLRDPGSRVHLRILEQNYRTDIASQQNLLRAYEGKEIQFQTGGGPTHSRISNVWDGWGLNFYFDGESIGSSRSGADSTRSRCG